MAEKSDETWQERDVRRTKERADAWMRYQQIKMDGVRLLQAIYTEQLEITEGEPISDMLRGSRAAVATNLDPRSIAHEAREMDAIHEYELLKGSSWGME